MNDITTRSALRTGVRNILTNRGIGFNEGDVDAIVENYEEDGTRDLFAHVEDFAGTEAEARTPDRDTPYWIVCAGCMAEGKLTGKRRTLRDWESQHTSTPGSGWWLCNLDHTTRGFVVMDDKFQTTGKIY